MELAELESYFVLSERGTYMQRWGAANPERRTDVGCNKKLCFVATDKALLVRILLDLSNHDRAVFVKYSRQPRAGMYLGRCFMLDEQLIGELWRKYKNHPGLMCSVQDDDWTLSFRAENRESAPNVRGDLPARQEGD